MVQLIGECFKLDSNQTFFPDNLLCALTISVVYPKKRFLDLMPFVSFLIETKSETA